MAAIGGSNLAKSDATSKDISKAYDLQRAGYIILLLVVLVLAAYAIFALLRLRSSSDAQGATRDAQRLTYFASVAIVFAAVRVLYSIVYAFNRSPKLSPVTATFAVRFVLIFLVQLLAALSLIVGGVVTRNIVSKSQ